MYTDTCTTTHLSHTQHSTTYPATCPVTRQVIDNPNALVDNTMLKSEIQRWQGRMRGEQSPREKLPTRYKTVGGLARGATHKRLSGDDTLIPQVGCTFASIVECPPACRILNPTHLCDFTYPSHRIL